jgi:hypothetical protein
VPSTFLQSTSRHSRCVCLLQLRCGSSSHSSLQDSLGVERPLSSTRIILPLLSSLTPVLPTHSGEKARFLSPQTAGFARDPPRMLRIDTNIEIMSSKEKPKKLLIFASDGKKYNFLCKMERKGDLRKDARLMEINSVVNRYVWSLRWSGWRLGVYGDALLQPARENQ